MKANQIWRTWSRIPVRMAQGQISDIPVQKQSAVPKKLKPALTTWGGSGTPLGIFHTHPQMYQSALRPGPLQGPERSSFPNGKVRCDRVLLRENVQKINSAIGMKFMKFINSAICKKHRPTAADQRLAASGFEQHDGRLLFKGRNAANASYP